MDKTESKPLLPHFGFITLGILAIAGVVLPVAHFGLFTERAEYRFINFTLLGEQQEPWVLKLMLIYPLIAGLIAIVLGVAVRNILRGIVLLAVAIFPLALMLVNEQTLLAFQRFDDAMPLGVTVLALGLLAWTCIYTTARTAEFAPGSVVVPIFGVLSAIALGLALALPVLPEAMGSFPAVAPFKLITGDVGSVNRFVEPQFIGMTWIVLMLLMLISAVLCVCIAFCKHEMRPRLARPTFMCLVIAAIIAFLQPFLIEWLNLRQFESPGNIVAASMFTMFKFCAMLYPLGLLVPLSITDMIASVVGSKPSGERKSDQ